MEVEFTYIIPNYPKSTKNLLFWMVLRETFVFISRSDMDLTLQVGDESPPFEMK